MSPSPENFSCNLLYLVVKVKKRKGGIMKRIGVFIAFLFVLFSGFLYADSPITSTDFYTAYKDIEMVNKAAKLDVITPEIAEFLSSPKNPVDVKAAVINALSWDINGKNNAVLYLAYLEKKYNNDIDTLTLEPLTADEVFCLGYLLAMDDYFFVGEALDLLLIAWELNDTSFTVSIILALVEAQEAMDYDWCEVWMLTEDVLLDESLKKDMRDEAITIIVDYMSLYKDECE